MKNSFRFGVNTLIWTENFSADDLWILPHMKELGFHTIDLSVNNPSDFPVREVKAAILQTGIEPVITTALPLNKNPISPDPKVRTASAERLMRIVDVANELGAEIVAGVIYAAWGYKTNRPRTEEEWKWSVEVMQKVAEYAKNTGNVVLAAEVINRYVTHFLNIARDAVQYCKDTEMDNVRVHLDSFHMIMEEESFSKAIRCCGTEYLAYFHSCESHRGIPGTGLVPWSEVFTSLHEIGYDGPLVIESYDPKFARSACNSCIWRNFASSGEELAVRGLKFFTEELGRLGYCIT